MEERQNILDELQRVGPAVANLSRENLFFVPYGYFENLADEVFIKIHLAGLPVYDPYHLPDGYFEEFAFSVLQKIKLQQKDEAKDRIHEELEDIAPLLNTISRQNVFDVPENYFEEFSINTAIESPRKVVSTQKLSFKWMMYASAACVAFLLVTEGYLWVTNHERNNKTEIAKNIEAAFKLNVEQGISSLSDEQIVNYLNNQNSMIPDVLNTPSEDEFDIQQLLNNASDDEIQQYLDNNNASSEKNIKGI